MVYSALGREVVNDHLYTVFCSLRGYKGWDEV